MSSGDGSKDLRPAISIVGGILSAAIIFSLIWIWSASYTENRIDAQSKAAEHDDSAIDNVEGRCLGLDPLLQVKCVTNAVDAANKEKREEYDLNAQRDMALWAFWMMAISGFASALTGIGILFVYHSLGLTKKAVDAAVQSNAVAREIGEAQVRAYLVCESANFSIHHDHVTCEPLFENSGQSPAQDFQIEGSICIKLSGFVFPRVPPHKPYFHHAAGLIGHCQAIGAGMQRSGLATILHSSIDKEAFSGLYNQDKYFDFRLVVSWRDVFKVRHSISVLLIEDRLFRGSAMEGILNQTAVIRGEMKAHNHGSNYDVEPDSQGNHG